LAPDRDDPDGAQIVDVNDDGGSPSDLVADAATTEPEDVAGLVAESGDTDTEATSAEDTEATSAEDTETTSAEEWHPAESPSLANLDTGVPDPGVLDTGVPDPGPPDPGVPDPGSLDTGVPADEQAPGPEAWSGDVPEAEDLTGQASPTHEVGASVGSTDVVANGRDPAPDPIVDLDSVGFDGRPMPGDGSAPADAVTDGADTVTPVPPSEDDTEPRRRTKAVVVLTILSLVVVGAGVGGVIWSRSRSKGSTPPPQAQRSSPSPTLSDGAFVTFKDAEAGFSIRYPRGWTRSQPPVAEIRLWATDGKQFAASVRVTRTEQVTTPANLGNLKAVTDGIVGPGVQILKQDPITVNGLIGFRYLYTLTDKDSGLTTAHLHYFLFQGHKMNSIVFEALPSETFSRIEGVFDQMLGTFHSDPEPP